MIGTKMKLDKSKSYGEIMGATNGARFVQDGKEFYANGELVITENAIIEHSEKPENAPKKLGRPFKNGN